VTVSSGTTLTVGSNNTYNQTGGTTTVDGTLAAGSSTGVNVAGGTLLGAGTLNGNTSNGATINVGDSGKAGLLTITGSYAQLSSAKLNVSIGGTTVATQYSQLKINGTASLAGTLTAALINSFTPTVGQTFTILTAGTVTGTFSNSTIAINSSEEFQISYTSNSVVLTVVSITPSNSKSTPPAQQAAQASGTQPLKQSNAIRAKNNLRRAVSANSKAIQVASLGRGSTGASDALRVTTRIWEHVPVAPSWDHLKATTIAQTPRSLNLAGAHDNVAHAIDNNWATTTSHAAPVAPTARWQVNSHRLPARMPMPALPVIR
jgi:Tfp pilus assembly protein PilV